MRILLLINGETVPLSAERPRANPERPTLDYHGLARGLTQGLGASVDLLDHRAAQQSRDPRVRLTRATAGPDAATACLGFLRRDHYDAIFTIGESVGIPLALLLKATGRRPRHVTLGHRMTAPKKGFFYKVLRVHGAMDHVLVYSAFQRDYARRTWGAGEEKVRLIPYCVDPDFFRPNPDAAVRQGQICSIGSEWRDQDTLLRAMTALPDLTLKLTAFSPWTKGARAIRPDTLPENVEARRYTYLELRELYETSMFSVVPVQDADFAAGITAIIEAMAMGKAVVTTVTRGCHPDIIRDGENGLLVPLHDAEAMTQAIRRLADDAALRARMGANARRWVEENATLGHWVGHIASAIEGALRAASAAPGYRAARRAPPQHWL
jgi:glycosyltransferase involved in cell wall biosynthesis